MTYMKDVIRIIKSFYPRQAKKEACLPIKKEDACFICFDDKIDPDLMFSVDNCGHRFCLDCVKQHIEVKLLDGMMPNCPHHGCESDLSIDRCNKLLTNKFVLLWKERFKENSTPYDERIYCPYQICSYMMSKTELISTSNNESGFRVCVKCNGSFCVHCKVPWHTMLSCAGDKKLHYFGFLTDFDAKLKSLANSNKWRQCGKCQHMVERSDGCAHMKCRCGYVFCYDCGAEWVHEHILIHRNCASRNNNYMASWKRCIIVTWGVLLLVVFYFIYLVSIELMKNH